jgi:hypothetical protein
MDGVSLSHLLTGLTYDLPPAIAHYLTANGYADEPSTTTPALVIALDDSQVLDALTGGVSISAVTDRAADKPRRRKRKVKRTPKGRS